LAAPSEPHFPGRATIEAYGAGGFRFAGLSHKGSILALPSGIWAWPPRAPAEIDANALARVFAERAAVDLLLLGTGRDPYPLPATLRAELRSAGFSLDVLPTPAAASTYNVLLAEDRRVAAALIAVE
jgi:uncharacterized protein